MLKNTILILGASGMLGATVFRSFDETRNFEVLGTVRDKSVGRFFSPAQSARLISLDVLDYDSVASLFDRARPDVVINCVGLVKQLAAASDPLVTLPINSLLPHRLARLCSLINARLIHISTDCVFSGSKGNYTEEDETDAKDLYGRSKLLGELINQANAITLRTSIIGRELNTAHSLVEWFLSQQGMATGYTKAVFSGLPTCELATVIRDVVVPQADLTGLYHVSAEPISKFDLLHLIAKQYAKQVVIEKDSRLQIDRSLDSSKFSAATGYRVPSWPELVARLYETDQRRTMSDV